MRFTAHCDYAKWKHPAPVNDIRFEEVAGRGKTAVWYYANALIEEGLQSVCCGAIERFFAIKTKFLITSINHMRRFFRYSSPFSFFATFKSLELLRRLNFFFFLVWFLPKDLSGRVLKPQSIFCSVPFEISGIHLVELFLHLLMMVLF